MRNKFLLPCLVLACAATSTLGALAYNASKPEASRAAIGRASYRVYCSSCHGVTGRGDGPIASSLKIPPADLTQLRRSHDGKFPVEEVITRIDGREVVPAHGPSDMPVWGMSFQDPAKDTNQEQAARQKILDIVAFLETLQEGAEASH
jgi:mono/diheme cytochrome c family protein